MTLPLAVTLAELRSPLEKGYRNTVYCAGVLVQDASGQLRGKYCGNRWCLVCNRARTARAIDRYTPIVASWPDPWFVTLTVPNVPAEGLPETISEILKRLFHAGRAIKRSDKLGFHALRKLECTYNPQSDTYHPHFHLVVKGQGAATALVARWLVQWPSASQAAQHRRPCDLGSLKELFKYFTKLTVERPNTASARQAAPAAALDIIFRAMAGRRVYQPMGFIVRTEIVNDEEGDIGQVGVTMSPSPTGQVLEWEWVQKLHDWVDQTTGELLSGFEPA